MKAEGAGLGVTEERVEPWNDRRGAGPSVTGEEVGPWSDPE